MSVGDIEPIPEGFLARLLQQFGIQWTHLVILSGVVFSSFGLQEYLNPGLWILGTVGAFSLVYFFRHQITSNFPKAALWAGIALLVGLSIPLILLLAAKLNVEDFLKSWTKAATVYLSVIIGIPIGTVILSYRAQGEFLRSPLPPALAKVTNESVSQSDFIHESVSYEIQLIPDKGRGVIMRFKVTMNLLNRLKRSATYQDIFGPAGRNQRFIYAAINGIEVDKDDPDRLSQRGLVLSYETKPNEKFQVMVEGESDFHQRDSELVGAYLPCEYLSIRIKKPPENLRVNVQSLVRKKVDTKRSSEGDILFEYLDGVLPYQGTRIYWETRD